MLREVFHIWRLVHAIVFNGFFLDILKTQSIFHDYQTDTRQMYLFESSFHCNANNKAIL